MPAKVQEGKANMAVCRKEAEKAEKGEAPGPPESEFQARGESRKEGKKDGEEQEGWITCGRREAHLASY